MHECDLARVSRAAEHAFAKKGGADRDAVEPADQHVPLPGFDAVRRAAGEEPGIEPQNFVVDPGVGTLFGRLGAAADNFLEGAVAADLETALPDDAAQPLRHVKAVERQDTAAPRIDPEQLRIVRRFAHRKDAGSIGGEQDVGGQPQRASAPITPSVTPPVMGVA